MNTCSPATHRRSIVLLVRSLEQGGAERQVIQLANALCTLGQSVKVVTFYDQGALRNDLRQTDVPVVSLGKAGRWDIVRFTFGLIRLLRRERPAVLHSVLTVPNVLAALIKPWLANASIVWGVRVSNMDLAQYDWLARATDRFERLLSPVADLIIFNSQVGRNEAVSRGYPAHKAVVVPNGIDTVLFRPDQEGRAKIRAQWGISDKELLVGLVARFDPMKDHENFLRAAAIVAERCARARFVCVGACQSALGQQIRALGDELRLSGRVIWAGARDDMRPVHNALDIACSSSRYGEGFSNAIAEAMACGVTCVVTNVGDSAAVVGATGVVVPPSDPVQFADGILRLIAMGQDKRSEQGKMARARIESEFTLLRLAQRTLLALAVV